MKRWMLLTALLCSCVAYTQEARVPVAVFPFGSVLKQDRGRAVQIHAMVLDVLRAKSNINLIDRSQDTLLIKELDHQITEYSMAADNLVEQGKVMGARHMLVGVLSNISVDRKSRVYNDPITQKSRIVQEYTATLNFTLQISDVETGKMISHKSFSSQQGTGLLGMVNLGIGTSAEDAIAKAILANRRHILSWINETYPPLIQILGIESRDKKGVPETIMVSGVDGTLKKGAKLVISEVQMIPVPNGPALKRVKKMAILKIMSFQGDVTVCRIVDGEKDIEEKMNAKVKMELEIM
jgi:hypothetical protein